MSFETSKWKYVPANTQKQWTEGKRPIRLIVIHTVESPETAKTAENVASYFAQKTTRASSHLVIDADSIIQSVLDNNIAAAAPGANTDGLHLELAGYAKQTEAEWLDPYGVLLLGQAADAAAQYCLKYDIPPVHLTDNELRTGLKGVVGHAQVTAVYKRSTHTDPGKSFPWQFFIERVQARVAALKVRVDDQV